MPELKSKTESQGACYFHDIFFMINLSLLKHIEKTLTVYFKNQSIFCYKSIINYVC